MRHALKTALVSLGALGALAVAPTAFAGCGEAPIQPATYQVGSGDAQLIKANLGVVGIVGLWSFQTSVSPGPSDWGYQQFHSDGTEIMNSGGHSPASANFCLGTWRQTGPNTYHLKHFPLAYDPATGNLVYKIVITEDVTVDATGNNFSGSTTLQFYSPTGAGPLFSQTGSVTGHRVLPN